MRKKRKALVPLTFALFIALAHACGKECKLSSQCDRGQHCDFTTGDCIDGCKTQDDCSPAARCDPMYGRCIPRSTGLGLDARTSSAAADATVDSAQDAGAVD